MYKKHYFKDQQFETDFTLKMGLCMSKQLPNHYAKKRRQSQVKSFIATFADLISNGEADEEDFQNFMNAARRHNKFCKTQT